MSVNNQFEVYLIQQGYIPSGFGLFSNDKGQTLKPADDIIFRMLQDKNGEVKRLRSLNKELVEALTELRDWYVENVGLPAANANAALKKAKEQS